jgi:hypothetical protein
LQEEKQENGHGGERYCTYTLFLDGLLLQLFPEVDPLRALCVFIGANPSKQLGANGGGA